MIELLYNLPTPEPVIGIRAGKVNYGWLYCRPPYRKWSNGAGKYNRRRENDYGMDKCKRKIA